ncbi:hypothetical protein AKG11_33285 [Shinella sp. SUS2]|nr:hypothetical protein [Shinella sp. SUS2]KNY09240.1 hypothetical protein AKG11_33285 [Shinella sp. SUS2]KOC71418.1 hypothetical protein AKG10_33185 [Shinella sp. GWS1]
MSARYHQRLRSRGRRTLQVFLSLEPDPQTPCSLAECFLATLQNIADGFSDFRILQAARLVGNRGKSACRMRASIGNDDLVRVRIDDEICVMCDHDDLSLGFCGNKQCDQLLEHRFGVSDYTADPILFYSVAALIYIVSAVSTPLD